MKKYIKVLVTFILTIIVIGFMYIHDVFANQESIMMKTMRGNDVEVKKVVLDFAVWNDDIYKPFRLEEGKLHMLNHFSVWSFLIGADHSPEIKNLIKNERSFMRTKGVNNENYFENEVYLAYVNLQYVPELRVENKGTPEEMEYHYYSYDFIVDVLEKTTGKQWSFTVDVPDYDKSSFIGIDDVQLVDGHLKVLVRINPWDREDYYQIYTLDFTEEKVVATTKIEVGGETMYLLNNYANLKPEKYYLFGARSASTEDEVPGDGSEIYYLFNLETEEMEETSLNIDQFGKVVTMEDNLIYFAHQNNGLEVTVYNVETEEVNNISLAEEQKRDAYITVRFNNGKYYITTSDTSNTIKIYIVDGESQELLYEGKIYHEDEKVEMYISGLTVL